MEQRIRWLGHPADCKPIGQNLLPTISQLTALSNLAAQCADTDGPAVFAAKSLFASLTGVNLVPRDCNTAASSRSVENPAIPNFNMLTIQPNPAFETVLIGWNLEGENTVVSVYNITGQLVKEEAFGMNENKTELDIRLFPSGIYTVLVQCGHNCRQAKQFVVQH